MSERKAIPEKIRRDLMREAGWRCAVPACRINEPLEFAHIKPVKENGENNFFNLIVLCSNCHGRFDKKDEKYMTSEQLISIKQNLMVLNGRYSSYEKRIMEYFLDNPDTDQTEMLWGRDIDIMYLIKDGLLVHDGKKRSNLLDFAPRTYLLTEVGKKFIHQWKSAIRIDDNCD